MKIYDSIHGFIRFDDLEGELIDSLPFQRLRHLHQLGIAFLVYPGATHSRFEHSLGVMHLASEIFDRLEIDDPYWKRIVRFAALCHDLGHLPFSHVAEKALLGEGGHEKWTIEVVRSPYLAPIWQKLATEFPGKDVVSDVIKISVGEKSDLQMSPLETIVSQVITGDFFGADRIDYLIRDAKCTGVPHGYFDYHQLIESIVVLNFGRGSEIGIEEPGLESCEALLIARHFMHRRVYQYATVKSYSLHLSRFMEKCFQVKGRGLDHYLSLTDNEVLAELRKAWREPQHPGHFEACCIFDRSQRSGEKEAPPAAAPLKLDFPVLRRDGSVVHAGELSAFKNYGGGDYEKNSAGNSLSLGV